MKNEFQRRQSGQPLVFSHRGAAATVCENTVASFEEAVRQGTDGIELDVRVTADGIPVVFHDADGTRLAGKEFRIAEIPYRQLASIFLEGEHGIPRLDTVLDQFGQRIFLDIEIKDKAAVPAVLEGIVRRHLVERVMVSSFDADVVIEVKRRLGTIRTGLIMGTRTMHPLVRLREALPLLPLMRTQAEYAVLHYRLLTPSAAFLLARAGIPTMTWAGLDEERKDPVPYFRALTYRMPAAIVTAWPERCRSFLAAIGCPGG